jgi:predicted nucleic acid-binding protein
MAVEKRFYWDACLFFEVLCDEPVLPAKKAALTEILQENKDGRNVIMTSVITHLECVPAKLEQKKPGALAKYEALFDGVKFADVEITANILKVASEIRSYYYIPYDAAKGVSGKMMDMGDAIHLATAIIYDAAEFHTRDGDDRGSKVPLLGIYDYSKMDKICGRYPLTILSPESAQGGLDL